MNDIFHAGIDTLLREHAGWLAGKRVGLVAHHASVGLRGLPSPELLRQHGVELVALFGPEHGYTGVGGAGEDIPTTEHADWKIPVYSLYGPTRRPTPEMLSALDIVVFDLQDLGARPYTYVSTLRHVLESAAENGKSVIVTDRPSPLANIVDGPMLDSRFESFVGFIPAPVVYGMTPGETALWLRTALQLEVDVRVAPMRHYRREGLRPSDWPPWIPSSPAIRSWECGLCFPITVFFEGLPAIDHGRGTATPFRLFGAPWLDNRALCESLDIAGLRLTPQSYTAAIGAHRGQLVHGARVDVVLPDAYRPVLAAVTLIHRIQELHGEDLVWDQPGTREEFFDSLMGTDRVRTALRSGVPPAVIASTWESQCAGFRKARESSLLYSS